MKFFESFDNVYNKEMFIQMLKYIGHLITLEICDDIAARLDAYLLKHIPDCFVTQEMCNKAVEKDHWMLIYVPDHLKTQEMCNEAAKKCPGVLILVPDWFVTQDMVQTWQGHFTWCTTYIVIKWYDRYKNRQKLKKNIQKELLLIAWHPDRYWHWFVPEDEKKELGVWFTK